MNTDEKCAKLLALSVLYENKETERVQQVQKITCSPKDFETLLNNIVDEDFKRWVKSVAHLFKS